MKKSVKTSVAAILACTLLISSGLLIGGKISEYKYYKEKANRVEKLKDDIAFNVSSGNEIDEETKDTDKKTSKDIEVDKEKEKDEAEQAVKNEETNKNGVIAAASINNDSTTDLTTKENIESSKNASTNKTVDSEKKAKVINLINANDYVYIGDMESKNKTKYNFEVNKIQETETSDDSIKKLWGIDAKDCYRAVATNASENDKDIYMNYLVDLNEGKIYMMPLQGGLEAYEVKNNQVVKVYSYKNTEESVKWR